MQPSFERIFDLLDLVAQHDLPVALAGKVRGSWQQYSAQQYVALAHDLANGLLALGVQPGQYVVTATNGRPEWNILDMAVMMTGAVHVAVYPTASEDEYRYILHQTEASWVFASNRFLFDRFERLRAQATHVQQVFSFDALPDLAPDRTLEGLLALGQAYGRQHPEALPQRKAAVRPTDDALIIYTSGTGGDPSGAVHTHANQVGVLRAIMAPMAFLQKGDKALSYIPVCHAYERSFTYYYQLTGVSIYYAQSVATVVDNLQDIQPNFFTTAPILLEKVFDNIQARGAALPEGPAREGFRAAVAFAATYDPHNTDPAYQAQHQALDEQVYSRWRQVLGGQLKAISSAGAPLPVPIARTFWAMGIPIYECYGLTEILVGTMNHPGQWAFGSVGSCPEGVEAQIAPDGEILIRSRYQMRELLKKPALMAQIVDAQGWLHTGDLGTLDATGMLSITGRKRDIFKAPNGRYVSPEKIEGQLRKSPAISQVVVVGPGKPFLSALIVPNYEYLSRWATEHQLDTQDLSLHPLVRELIQQEIQTAYNDRAWDAEQVRRFALLPSEWTVEAGELTPSLKVKRSVVTQRLQAQIDALYQDA